MSTPDFFTPLEIDLPPNQTLLEFQSPFAGSTHPWACMAVDAVKLEIETNTTWSHNFGFDNQKTGFVRGKMFGVLVVQNTNHQIGYLKAFSGKLDNNNHHPGFVPPVFDALTEGSFLNRGMIALSEMTHKIMILQHHCKAEPNPESEAHLQAALQQRKEHSQSLHAQFYNAFSFVNRHGDHRSLRELFCHAKNGNPPAGAGECAAPKLYQFAFLNHFRPVALAEFYWGAPISDESCVHGSIQPCCEDKCRPILTFMLDL